MSQANNASSCFLGIDTGTSKTHALITDFTGNVLGYGISGSGNYEVVGFDGFKKAMSSAAEDALIMAGVNKDEFISMGFGISGYDWPSEQPVMIEAIQSLGFDCNYQFVNDVTIGLIAGASEGWGVAVDAGTGNNVRGRDRQGRIGRITGNSVWHGEIGGGGEMAWLAQIAVTHAWTQRGPKTKLTQSLINLFEVSNEFALVEGLATGQIHIPSTFAKEIFRLAAQGDQVAHQIINTSASELALNVNAVIRQLNLQDQTFDLVLIGSIFKAGELYLWPFRQTVHAFAPGAILKQLSIPPVVGAVMLAAESSVTKPQNFRETVSESLQTVWIDEDIHKDITLNTLQRFTD